MTFTFAGVPAFARPSWRPAPLIAAGVFAASTAIAVLFLALLPGAVLENESADFDAHYASAARGLLDDGRFVASDGSPAVRYPPGYPLVLAAVFGAGRVAHVSEPSAVLAFNVSAFGVSSLLLYLIAARLWGQRPALLAWVAWATYPLGLYLLKQPNSEVPFLIALLGGVLVVAGTARGEQPTPRQCVLAGAAIGAAMLIRPIAIGLGLVLAGLVFAGTRRRRALAAGMLLAGNLVVVVPWEVWAYRATGTIIPLSTGGAASMRDGLTFAVKTKGYRNSSWTSAASVETMQRLSDQYEHLSGTGAVVSAVARELVEHPRGVVELLALKAARSWYGTDSNRLESLTAALQAAYLVVVLVTTVAIWRRGGHARRTAIGTWTLVLYFWAMTIAGLSIVRYMTPAMSLLFLLLPGWRASPAGPADSAHMATTT